MIIDLNGSKTFSCFTSPQTAGVDTIGNIKGYELHYTTDGTNWIKVSEGEFKVVTFLYRTLVGFSITPGPPAEPEGLRLSKNPKPPL